MESRSYYTYIVRCSDGTYYTGVTNSYERRVLEHNEGKNPKSYTFSRRPVTLVYAAEFTDIYEAIECEKMLKGWSRKKKEALMNGDQKALQFLSKRKYVQGALIKINRAPHVALRGSAGS